MLSLVVSLMRENRSSQSCRDRGHAVRPEGRLFPEPPPAPRPDSVSRAPRTRPSTWRRPAAKSRCLLLHSRVSPPTKDGLPRPTCSSCPPCLQGLGSTTLQPTGALPVLTRAGLTSSDSETLPGPPALPTLPGKGCPQQGPSPPLCLTDVTAAGPSRSSPFPDGGPSLFGCAGLPAPPALPPDLLWFIFLPGSLLSWGLGRATLPVLPLPGPTPPAWPRVPAG